MQSLLVNVLEDVNLSPVTSDPPWVPSVGHRITLPCPKVTLVGHVSDPWVNEGEFHSKEWYNWTMRMEFEARKLSDLDSILPGLDGVWKAIRKKIDTKVRCPKRVYLTDEPNAVHMNDGESGRRFALELSRMELSDSNLSVSSGEWACHGGDNNDREINEIPNGFALVDAVWHDYYRYAVLTVVVAPGALTAQLKKG